MNLVSSYFQTSIQPTLHRRRNWLLLPLLLLLISCGGSLGGTPVPTELRGQWQTILSYIPVYFPKPIVVRDFNASLGFYFYFWPDGRYEHQQNLLMSYFDNHCFRTARWRELGTVSIEGSEFSFRPTKATHIATDTCAKSEYLDPAPVKPYTLSVTPDQDQAGWPYLRLRLPTDEELLLEKCRDCK